MLAPLTDNPNAQDPFGYTPIIRAAEAGNAKVIKILLPFTDNPNAPDHLGQGATDKLFFLLADTDKFNFYSADTNKIQM